MSKEAKILDKDHIFWDYAHDVNDPHTVTAALLYLADICFLKLSEIADSNKELAVSLQSIVERMPEAKPAKKVKE